MSGLMNGFGDALRTAGGVVSPDVYDQQNKEMNIAMNRLQQLQAQLISGVESGSVDPQALTKVGLPPNLIGPSPQAQVQRAQLEADQRLREGLKGKNIGTTSSDLMSALVGAGMDSWTGPMGAKLFDEVSRRQSREDALQQKYDAMAQQKEIADRASEDKRLSIDEHREASRNSLAIQLKMAQMVDATKRMGIDLRSSQSAGSQNPDDLDNQVALARQGMQRQQVVGGWGKDATAKWTNVVSGAIQQIMDENPGMTRIDAAQQFASEQQGYKATGAAITQNTKDLTAIRPFKEMLDTNAKIAIGLSKSVLMSDSAMANKSINWLKQNAADNPDTNEYLAQMRFVQTEAARVLNNPRLVGQLTDTARKEMDEIVSGNMPLNSTERVLNRIMSDGQNRVNSLIDERNRLMKKAPADSGVKLPLPSSGTNKGVVSLDQYLKAKGY